MREMVVALPPLLFSRSQENPPETLNGLAALVRDASAERIVFLGDFLHSARSHAPATLQAIARWCEGHVSLARSQPHDAPGLSLIP